jgi:hypothetical protein
MAQPDEKHKERQLYDTVRECLIKLDVSVAECCSKIEEMGAKEEHSHGRDKRMKLFIFIIGTFLYCLILHG